MDCRSGPSDYAFFWRPGGAGYTSNLNDAGLYTREEYESLVGRECAQMAFVPQDVAERHARVSVLFHDIARPEWARREDFRTARQAETLRAVFG